MEKIRIMHCDEKRTISALKQYVLDTTSELDDLKKQLISKQNNLEIQNKIKDLQKAIQEAKDQLSSMND